MDMKMLADMRLSAMATELANQLKDPSFAALGFEERLDMIVTAEWNKRQTNKINRLIKSAHFSASSATIEGIEYYEDRKLDKTQILRLATCNYIDEGHHVILKGASGNGKTYIACALGNAACRRLKKVAYIRLPELLDEITIARSRGEMKKLQATCPSFRIAQNRRKMSSKDTERRHCSSFWRSLLPAEGFLRDIPLSSWRLRGGYTGKRIT